MKETYSKLILTFIVVAVLAGVVYGYWLLSPTKREIESRKKTILVVPGNILEETVGVSGKKLNGQFPLRLPKLGKTNPFRF